MRKNSRASFLQADLRIDGPNRGSSAKTSQNRYRRGARRRIQVEALEKRELLAVVVGGEGLWASTPYAEQALIDFHGTDLQGKDGPMSNVGLSLLTAYHEYEGFLRSSAEQIGPAALFRPSDGLMSVINDRIIVDLVADVSGGSGEVVAESGAGLNWANVESLTYELQQLGAQVTGTWGAMVSALVPIPIIPQLASLTSLQTASASAMARNVGLVTSQGDQAMGSDVARALNEVDGSGITVGVLSDSFDWLGGAAVDVANGDLPEGIQVLADTIGSDEGRAMMQLIADVAPAADQAFHTAFLGQAGFANGITRLADEAGADVIVDDVFYYAEPMFQDGVIAQAVDQVVAGGKAYFSSAGNQGRNAYESEFRNSGLLDPLMARPQHDFDPGPGVDTFQKITVPVGKSFIMVLQWDSPFASVSPASGGSTNDLDVVIYDSTGTIALSGSLASNVGGDAIEIFRFVNFGGLGESFNLSISKFNGLDPGYLKYVIYADSGVEIVDFDSQSGTTYGHAFAAGAESVGAAFYAQTPEFGVDPPQVEYFSSAGGSPSGVVTPIFFDTAGNRLASPEIRDDKPGIVAPDGTNTTFFIPGVDAEGDGFPNFFGTSAAAPHAAAVAALMLSSAGGPESLSPTEIYTTLRDTAIDMDDPDTPGFDVGFDYATGFGLIDAEAAINAVALPAPPVVPFPTPLVAIDPAGSLIYEGSVKSGIDFAEDTDGYTIAVDPGQTITVLVETEDSLQASVELFVVNEIDGNRGPLADSTFAALPGEDLLLQTVATRGQIAGIGPGPQTYLIDVAGLAGTTGGYKLRVILNSAIETESIDGPSNDDLASAQDLNASFIALHNAIGGSTNANPQPARGAVLGSIEGTEDVVGQTASDLYSFNLIKGQSATLALASLNGGDVQVELLDSAGNVVATGLPAFDLIENGSFESGDFTGWTVATTNIPSINWTVGMAGAGTGFGFAPLEPQDGQFVAWNSIDSFSAPMQYTMSQDVTIPSDAPFAELNWQDRVQWNFTLGAFASIPRTYEVQVRDVNTDAVLETLYAFSTDTQSVNPTGDTGWQTHTADLTSYRGETIRLFIVESVPESGTGPAQIEFDAFALSTGQAAPPTNVNDLISNFVAPIGGTYYVRVTGVADADYSLVVSRGADFSVENNDSFESAQPILSSQSAGKQWVLGSIGTETVTLDGFDSGWWNNLGDHSPNNLNYYTGLVPGFAELRNFVTFDVPEVPSIVAAQLRLFNPASPPRNGNGFLSDDPTETFGVFDVTTPIGDLIAGGSGKTAIFDDLGSGKSYGSRVVSADDNGKLVSVDLNRDAINDLLAARGSQFATGGALTTLDGNDGLQRLFAFNIPDDPRQLTLTVSDRDYYAIEVNGNTSVTIETSTPADQFGEFVNRLDAKVWLYDSTGKQVAANDNGASDRINARLQYKVPKNAGGTYYVVVGASDESGVITTGEYLLSVQGNSLTAEVAVPQSLATSSPGVPLPAATPSTNSNNIAGNTSKLLSAELNLAGSEQARLVLFNQIGSQQQLDSDEEDLLALLAADLHTKPRKL